MSVDVNDVMAGLSKNVRSRVFVGDVASVERQKTPSVSLNRGLAGGFGYGRQVLIWGNKSSGKSSLCMQTIGLAQQEGKVCALIDAENGYDKVWAGRLGVNTSQLLIAPVKTMNDMVDAGVQLMKAGVDLIVVDSITSLLPAIYFDKKGDIKDLVDTGQIGSASKDTTRAVKMLNYANENTLLMIISQSTTFISQTYTKQMPTNGQALQFFSSTIVKLSSSEAKDKVISEPIAVGDKLINMPVAREVDWNVTFNKLGPPLASGDYRLRFAGDSVGIDTYHDAANLAVQIGVVEQASSWYSYKGEKAQGFDTFIEMLKMSPEMYGELLRDINEQ